MTRRAVGATLLAIAVVVPAVRAVVVGLVDWTPVEIPLDADGRAQPRQEFAVGRAGQYVLAIRIDRPQAKPRADEAECLLGFDRVQCAGIRPVQIRWHLASAGGATVHCADPMNGGRFTPASVERWLGCFDAHEDTRYALEVDAVPDLDRLAPLNPRFVVVSSDALDREEYSRTAAVGLVSILAGLAGLLLLLDNRS